MEGTRKPRRWIACYVAPEAFAAGTRQALERLGYVLVFGGGEQSAGARIVDASQLAQLPGEQTSPGTPVIALTGRPQPPGPEPGVLVGTTPRPARLVELYPLLQRALEKTPRSALRAPARLAARCSAGSRRWPGVVLSLSANGCLLQSRAPMPEGLELDLLFSLPLGRIVSTRARVQIRSRQGEHAGLAFEAPPESIRQAISDFVESRVLSGAPA